jgi:4'-phosphopantetheinyl transferase
MPDPVPVRSPQPVAQPVSHPVAGPVARPVAEPLPGELPIPAAGRVEVFWAELDPGSLAEDTRDRLAADLDEATARRVARYVRPADRDRGLAAHALLRRVLAAVVGGRPSTLTLATRCGSCGSAQHGKPFLDRGGSTPPVEVNLSHSGPVVCVALGAPGAGVGVDVEAHREVDWSSLRRSVFTDAEWEATERTEAPQRGHTDAWARKEASVKACGHGLALSMRRVVVSTGPDGAWRAELPDGVGSAAGRDLALRPDVAAAVAVHHPGSAGGPRPAGRPEPLASPVMHFVTIF